MTQENTNKPPKVGGCFILIAIWLVVFAGIAVAYRLIIYPAMQEKPQVVELPPDKPPKPEPIPQPPRPKAQDGHIIHLSLDSFSGYASLRSPAFQRELDKIAVKLQTADDGADWDKRYAALADGSTPMAVFTIDAYLKACARHAKIPGVMVAVLDESHGADAMITCKTSIKTLKALDTPNIRFVVNRNSPSELLARVIVSNFDLPQLAPDWMIGVDGPEALYQSVRGKPCRPDRVYVTWEPYVSRMLKEMPDTHVLLDTSRIEGYILDVLVVRQDFLTRHRPLITQFLKAYFDALKTDRDAGMYRLLMQDANGTLDTKQAQRIASVIRWKSACDNYQYFGLEKVNPIQHIETSLSKIVDVLLKTDGLDKEPFDGEYGAMYDKQILSDLLAQNYRPMGLSQPETAKPKTGVLMRSEWDSLNAVGRMRVESISFGRGGASINLHSQRELDKLVRTLNSWPEYYLKVIGHARNDGDVAANRRLSKERAEKVRNYLVEKGVKEWRLLAVQAAEELEGSKGQSVSFTLLER